MGQYDITVKYLAQKHPLPYIRLALPDFNGTYQVLPKHLPALETQIDFLIEATVEGQTFILHPDFQTRYEYMPRRMLDYRVHITHIYGSPVFSAVIWMTEEDYPGPGPNRLVETVAGHQQLAFEFLEVRLWEMDPEPALASGETALLPLVPLMGAPSESALSRSVALVDTVPDDEERAGIYTGISVLGGLRYSRDLIRSLIRSEQMSRSVIYDEIMEEGALKARRGYIVEALEERLGAVPGDLSSRLESVTDGDELSRLFHLALRCRSIDEFLASLAPEPHV